MHFVLVTAQSEILVGMLGQHSTMSSENTIYSGHCT